MKKVKIGEVDVEVMDADDLKALTKSVTDIANGLKDVSTKSTAAQAALLKKVEELGKPPKGAPPKPKVTEDKELEVMSRKEFMAHIVGEMTGTIQEALKGVKGDIDSTKSDLSDKELKAQLKEVQKNHPDFLKWKEELGAVLTENPGLSLERAYKMVRAENTEKAVEMDKEHKLKDGVPITEPKSKGNKTGDDSLDGESGKPKVLGLTPTSGQTKDSKAMSTKDASTKAWDEVMAEVNLGGE